MRRTQQQSRIMERMKQRKPSRHVNPCAAERANQLIEALLKQMQRAVEDHALLESPEWEKLFGAKQSMVVNLQKLVQSLAVLTMKSTQKPTAKNANPEEVALTNAEITMLSEWLGQISAQDQ